MERLIESIMNPAFCEKLYEFFRRELEQLDRLGSKLSKEEYVTFRRAMLDYTLSGETVKSNGEKFIADFLFEHGIPHQYEKVWSWEKQDRLYGTAYRPDFSIIDSGRDVILEHWVIDLNDSSSQVPGWWETNTRDYRDQIEAKRKYWSKRGVALLETHAGMPACWHAGARRSRLRCGRCSSAPVFVAASLDMMRLSVASRRPRERYQECPSCSCSSSRAQKSVAGRWTTWPGWCGTNLTPNRAIVFSMSWQCMPIALTSGNWRRNVVAVDKIWLDEASDCLEAATSLRNDGGKIINWELAKALKACVDYIVASVFTDAAQEHRWIRSALILARTGHAYGVTLDDFGRRLGQVLKKHPDMQNLANDFAVGKRASDQYADTALIEVMTAHKSKGKEANTVIVLQAVSRQFPKVHSDNQLFGPFGVTAEDVLAEERRLFYVAATRAEHRLMLLTETGKESPYLRFMQGTRIAGNPSAKASNSAPKRNLSRIIWTQATEKRL